MLALVEECYSIVKNLRANLTEKWLYCPNVLDLFS